ncbi:DUF5615 family PIN-like protein [Planctellipticum variicoloris]|uniref:DUF5615 family PIN-like protein n=1 Tax=Planctellipticum variicoloris TaxID=3064265 RepID=UPI0030134665|nr:DUF5615 family PIN-like protein [Planctomycetaceae bacterium SH412]
MNWLLDENLPRRLQRELAEYFADMQHVGDLGLEAVDDEVVWEYAREHGLTIVFKDSDFQHLSARFGAPPKVIWLRAGNRSTKELASWLLQFLDDIRAFESDAAGSLLVLGEPPCN